MDEDKLVDLAKAAEEVKKAARIWTLFASWMTSKSDSGWRQIKTDKGKAFVRILMRVNDIDVSDNFAAPDTVIPQHLHKIPSGTETNYIYMGQMNLHIGDEVITLTEHDKPYTFDAGIAHYVSFSETTCYIATLKPPDPNWPESI
jgi:hypothetical protein